MDIALLALVIVGGIVVVALFGIGWWRLARERRARWTRTELLRVRFGREYERVVAIEGKHDGEEALVLRLARFGSLDHRSVSRDRREMYTDEWGRLQSYYGDAPACAIQAVERLVVTVMEARGVRSSDGTTRADALSVMDPDLADVYRRAHRVFCLGEHDCALTEQIVAAMGWYRDLLERLLERPRGDLARPNPQPLAGRRHAVVGAPAR